MTEKFKAVKGTKDILPNDSVKWQTLEQTVHEFMNRWGYGEIRTPAFERTELFTRSVGEESDIVSKQMYTFLDQSKTSLTLKPELTAPVMRAYLEHNLDRGGALTKLYYIDALFRQERPQKGRLRQFHQFGAEAVGSPHPEQDVEIIGWAVNRRMTKSLVIKAMDRAIRKRRPTGSPIFHSDRGSQYASYAFRRLLAENHIRQSMSGKGNCYDNAMAESFFKTLKTELIYQNKYQTRQEAKQDTFEYIEVFYNRQRLHSALGYRTPVEYGELQNVA
jgi:histidyl-tRNA synthetase